MHQQNVLSIQHLVLHLTLDILLKFYRIQPDLVQRDDPD